MNEAAVIEEMVDMLFAKKWRKRVKYDFVLEKRRKEAFLRYNNGEYLEKTVIKYNVAKMKTEDIYSLIQKEGGKEKCFLIVYLKSGIYDSLEGIKEVMKQGLGGILYFGNGVGYFQGEQFIGSPDRYILVNKKEKLQHQDEGGL